MRQESYVVVTDALKKNLELCEPNIRRVAPNLRNIVNDYTLEHKTNLDILRAAQVFMFNCLLLNLNVLRAVLKLIFTLLLFNVCF